ncbi:MAG: riboflavin kinase [Rikenellaceae bacterium]|nr:riboflavin kinase [Rikenellaceae bacterium]
MMTLPMIVSGKVVRGNRIGRQLGFPTANIPLQDQDRIEDGVYAVRVWVKDRWYEGVANAGARPTVTDAPERFLEVFIFAFNGDIYGATLRVELVEYLRAGRKFTSVEALRRQIQQDKTAAEAFFRRLEQREKK